MDYLNVIKESFQKVKEDMYFLQQEIDFLKLNLEEINSKINNLSQQISVKNNDLYKKTQINTSTQNNPISTYPAYSSTHNMSLEALKPQNMPVSIGNQGASTDRQTDRQTDKKGDFSENSIEKVSKMIDSLDNLKKEIRLKFKRLTEQELLVFSTIYQLCEEQNFCDYKILSKKLNLSESSIRDYVQRLLNKEIPVDKQKINNKSIHLSIPANLKKIASLHTILQLREL